MQPVSCERPILHEVVLLRKFQRASEQSAFWRNTRGSSKEGRAQLAPLSDTESCGILLGRLLGAFWEAFWWARPAGSAVSMQFCRTFAAVFGQSLAQVWPQFSSDEFSGGQRRVQLRVGLSWAALLAGRVPAAKWPRPHWLAHWWACCVLAEFWLSFP